ncbi:MAG: hypothetical protein LC792_12650 [Actinobacteria bacterium]|nr:hypothetical protein [Actinomycetota bacterium]
MTQMRLRRAASFVLPVVLLAGAACSGGGKKEATTTTSAPTTTSTAPTTTTGNLTKEEIVLGADGVGASLKFGTNAAHTINRLMQALGQPEKNTPLPAGQACGATRRLQWANFQVLVNEVTTTAGAGRPGFAGWYLGTATGPALDFKTEKGIGVNSTVAALNAAYGPDVSVQGRGEQGPGFTITQPTGIIVGLLTAATDAGKIKNLQAGNYCGAA